MKKILLLGGSAQQVIAIETAKRLGYYTILCDFLADNPGQYVADKFYLISTTDKDAVLEVAKKEEVNGVLAYASDPAAPTAAYVAEMMNLPGNPYESVEILCNKDQFRKFLEKNNLNTPKAHGYTRTEDVLSNKLVFKYPIIIKPVDSSGSKGTTVLYSEKGLEKAIEFAFSFSRCQRIIVEDYVEKKHSYLIGGDIFIIDKKIVLWGLMNCHRDNRVNPLVPVGKSYPLELREEEIEKVKVTITNIVEKLEISNGPMNVELVLDKDDRVWPIDIGPRSGGNMIPELLGDIFGVDIAKMSIYAAMGEKIQNNIKESQGYFATYNLHSMENGIYKNMIFSSEIEKYIYRTCLYKKQGDIVEYFDNASKCLGIIFMHFDNREKQQEILKKINENIKPELEEINS